MKYESVIVINNKEVGIQEPTYFIADIAANHDGDLERAKELIWLARDAGADAVKFQHFIAGKIVSDYGFKALGAQASHQASWGKSVFEVYRENECNRDWSNMLADTARQAGVDFMTTPYDEEAVEMLDSYIPAYKIGSGDITWCAFIEKVAKKGKPVLLATGASDMSDVERAVGAVLRHNRKLILLQCNTNYTGDFSNFRYINLRVLQAYALRYPGMVLGLSDHTSGHTSVLGAVALGARVIEKHFTDDTGRIGPDHAFSMTPKTWGEMVRRTRELESALGTGVKQVEANERDTVILQRRCIRVNKDLPAGSVIKTADLDFLRPAPCGAVMPYQIGQVVGRKIKRAKKVGESLTFDEMED